MRYLLATILLVATGATGANLIRNSSFEVGGRAGWTWEETDEVRAPTSEEISDTYTQHGTYSLRIPLGWGVTGPNSWPFVVDSGQYTVSGYFRFSGGGSRNVTIGVTDIESGTSYSAFASVSDSAFTRVDHTFTLPSDTAVYVWASSSSVTPAYLYADAFQLEAAASASAYAPMNDLEIGGGINSSFVGNAFFETDTIEIPINFYNNSGGNITNTVQYHLIDNSNAVRNITTSDDVVFPTGLTTINYTPSLLSASDRGYYRLDARAVDRAHVHDQIAFSVLPVTNTLADLTNAMWGSHTKGSVWHSTLARRMGFVWSRTLSGYGTDTSNPFKWSWAEPSNDSWQFDDFAVTNSVNAGLLVFANITASRTAGDTPAWAISGSIDTNHWADFIDEMVTHYGPNGLDAVSHWEILNEFYDGSEADFGAEEASILIQIARDVIKAEDPTAVVYAPAAGTTRFQPNAEDLLGTYWSGDSLDVWTYHGYAGTDDRQNNFSGRGEVSNVVQNLSWTGQIFNSEGGWNTGTGYDSFWELTSGGGGYGSQDGRSMMRGFYGAAMFGRLGPITDAYMWYDGRTRGTAWKPGTWGPWEPDGVLKPSGVILAVSANFIQGVDYYGGKEYGPEVNAAADYQAAEFHTWDKGSDALGMAMAESRTNTFTLTVTESPVTLYDMMGNEISGSSCEVAYNRPVWVIGSSMTGADLYAGMAITTNATETVAPNVVISIHPGAATTTLTRFKWSAQDNASLHTPGLASTDYSLQYEYYLSPTESTWQPAVTNSWADYASVPATGTFYVKATDEAGNETTTSVTWPFVGSSPGSATITTVNATNLNIGP